MAENTIIDGCDVSGCVYRAEEKCILKDDGCYFFPNCDHKQLKRTESKLACKEQKLAKIKEYVEDNEWCLLDHTYKELLQIIEGKENG